jgi:polar amino acid transport system ATP-binding protein
MADGAIIEEGLPAEIFRAPTHDRTRRFLSALLER